MFEAENRLKLESLFSSVEIFHNYIFDANGLKHGMPDFVEVDKEVQSKESPSKFHLDKQNLHHSLQLSTGGKGK